MPNENETPVEMTEPKPGAEITPEAEPQKAPEDFEAWLAAQPDEVKGKFDAHVGGLKSALDKERRANKRRDDAEAKAKADAEAAKLGEVEKRDKRVRELEAENQALLEKIRISEARDALMVAAEKIKVTFASQQALQDAIRFALESAEFDDDGHIGKPEEALKAAIKDRQFLIKHNGQPAPSAPDTNAGDKGGSKTPIHDEQSKRELAARYGVKPQYIK